MGEKRERKGGYNDKRLPTGGNESARYLSRLCRLVSGLLSISPFSYSLILSRFGAFRNLAEILGAKGFIIKAPEKARAKRIREKKNRKLKIKKYGENMAFSFLFHIFSTYFPPFYFRPNISRSLFFMPKNHRKKREIVAGIKGGRDITTASIFLSFSLFSHFQKTTPKTRKRWRPWCYML